MSKGERDWLGSAFGLLTFLGGVALLALTFRLAYDMFHVAPETALGVTPGKTLQLAQVGSSFAGVLIRILLLLVMGLMGSLIANRGILLISHSRPHRVRETPPNP